MQNVCSQVKLFEPQIATALKPDLDNNSSINAYAMHSAYYQDDCFDPWSEDLTNGHNQAFSNINDCAEFDIFSNVKL